MLEVKGRASVFWYWAGAGAVFALMGWVAWDLLWDGGMLLRIVPISLFASGAAFVLMGIWRVVDKRPAIAVDEKGVLDRTSLPSRLLTWAEILDFRLTTDRGRQPSTLAIDLVEPSRFIDKAMLGSGAVLEELQKKHGTPCVISLKTLDIEPHDLLERLKSALRQHKR